MLMNASFISPENTPTTKEACYYGSIFERFFPKGGRYTFPMRVKGGVYLLVCVYHYL